MQNGVAPEQAAPVPHKQTAFAASHVSASRPHAGADPHKHASETHVSPDMHVTEPHGAKRVNEWLQSQYTCLIFCIDCSLYFFII